MARGEAVVAPGIGTKPRSGRVPGKIDRGGWGPAESRSGCGGQHPSAGERTARDEAECQHLVPLLVQRAELEASDPRRRQLLDQLVRGYLPLAIRIARRYANRGESLDDLIQVATLGLILAIERFDLEIGTDFLAFAVPTIQGEVRKHFRDRGWAMRVSRRLKDTAADINAAVSELSQRFGRAPRPSEIAQWLDIDETEVLGALEAAFAYRPRSLELPVSIESGDQTIGESLGVPDARLELVEDHEALAPLLDELPDRERRILLMRFYGNMTQRQIATQLGISQMHVSRLLAQTLAHLRRRLTAHDNDRADPTGDARNDDQPGLDRVDHPGARG